MSSADNETGADAAAAGISLHQAISSQGALLGQHETLLRSLVESNNALLKQVSQLTGQVSQLSIHAVPPASIASQAAIDNATASVSSSLPVPVREPNVPVPERYSGDIGTCQSFLTQVSLVFDLQPLSYSTERAKIAYLVSLLSGAAREWGTSVWERQEGVCQSYQAFVGEMKKVFDHPIQGKDAGYRLLSIRQGTRRVTEYAIEFRTLAASSGWNDESLQGAFYAGLQDNIKDELSAREETSSLDQTVALATRIDNRLRERRRERTRRSESPRGLVVRGTYTPHGRRSPEPEPMQIGRVQLSAEERQHRRDANACMYCGKPGHYLATCPQRREKESAHR